MQADANPSGSDVLTAGSYRDATDGANARRQALLRKRRDDFAELPHALRRVFVARTARIVASVFACAAGTILLATSAAPELAAALGVLMPGPAPAVLANLLLVTWIGGALAYVLGRAVAEHRFAVRISETVLPRADVFADVERLGFERPADVGRRMAARRERASIALPLVAAAMLLPATMIYAWLALMELGYPSASGIEHALSRHDGPLLAAAALGLAAALLVRRRAIGAWAAPLLLAGAGAGTCAALLEATSLAAWLTLGPVAVGIAGRVLARILARERAAIAAEDPRAGAEIFELRAVVARLRARLRAARAAITLANLRRLARRARGDRRVQLGLCAGLAAAGVAMWQWPAPTEARAETSVAVAPTPLPSLPSTQLQPGDDGALDVLITFTDAIAAEIPAPMQLEALPPGWQMRMTIERIPIEGETGMRPVFVTPMALTHDLAPRQLSASTTSVEMSYANCSASPEPLTLTVDPYGDAWDGRPYQVALRVTPVLELASCTGETE